MNRLDDGLLAALLERGVSRRSFLKFCAAMTATLAIPASHASEIAAAVAAAPRLPLIWLHGQACAGNTSAFLRASDPTTAELLIDLLSVEYHETLMAASGAAAERSRVDAMAAYPNGYLAVVEGGIPTADGGIHCLVGGRAFRDIVREVCDGAAATIAVGSCAFDGGTPAASGGETGAVGVDQVVPAGQLVSLPGCPLNVDNLAATIVYYLRFKKFPPTDARRRPLFAYGGLIHNQCERRGAFEFGQYVTSWGDEGAQKGWCLYKMGCKGPEVNANCPSQKYAEGTSWAVRAGHGCIGCTMPRFWDAMGPAYARLPAPIPFVPNVSADMLGGALVAGVAAVTVVHGGASYVRQRRAGVARHPEPGAAPAPAGVEVPVVAAEVVGAATVAADEPPSVDLAAVNGAPVGVAAVGGTALEVAAVGGESAGAASGEGGSTDLPEEPGLPGGAA
jgi:hydrogenase small subunit